MHAKEYPIGIQSQVTNVTNFDNSWVSEGDNSFGPFCKPMGHWRINNAGWNSVFDYFQRVDYSRGRVAILGNSYVEGWASDVDSHIDAELYDLFSAKVDVYAFGLSGLTFAQYLGLPFTHKCSLTFVIH